MAITDENLREYCRQQVQKFISGLRSQIEEEVYASARQLQHYICTELQTLSSNGVLLFMDEMHLCILDYLKKDEQDKKGLILGIIILVSMDVGNTNMTCTRSANILRKLVLNDIEAMEFTAYAIGRIAIAFGQNTSFYVNFEVPRAFEMLMEEENEAKKYLGILILQELAIHTPDCFIIYCDRFFETIFTPLLQTQNKALQESAIKTLRAVLYIVCTKGTNRQRAAHFQHCLTEALSVLDIYAANSGRQNSKDKLFRDDRVYGALLILEELLKCADLTDDKLRSTVDDITYEQHVFESSRSRFQVKREWGEISITQCLRTFIHSNSQNYSNNGLQTLLNYHSQMGFKPNSLPNIRCFRTGSSLQCKNLITANFNKIMRSILREKDSTNTNIQKSILKLIPRMAQFNLFYANGYFSECIQHVLLYCARRHKERSIALISLGLLSAASRLYTLKYMPRIMNTLKSYLQVKDIFSRKKVPSIEPAVIICINLLAQSLGTEIQHDLRELIDPLLSGELSPALNDTLYVICNRMPVLKREIQEKLFKLIFHILIHKRYLHSGAPKMAQSNCSSIINTIPLLINTPVTEVPNDSQSIILSLKMLTRFDFNYKQIIQMYLHNFHDYLLNPNVNIRLESVRSCFKLLYPLLNEFDMHHSTTLVSLIQDLLHKLLTIAKMDPNAEIRYTVLSLLGPEFDNFLTQSNHLAQLFVCLNDEVFVIRELSICIIGRLSELNPAFVKPRLRNILIELMNNLESSGSQIYKEQSTKMLAHLITYAPNFSALYTNSILKMLIDKLKSQDGIQDVLNVLYSIGLHARVVGIGMRKYFDTLFPLLLEIVQDSSNSFKREIGLWTLGQIVDNSGCVIDPYWKYKNLLDMLLNIFRTEQSCFVRREAIKVLGLLGAVDPYEHKINVGLIDQSGSDYLVDVNNLQEIQDLNSAELMVNLSTSYENFYLAISITNMLKILRDPSLSSRHIEAIESVNFLFITFSLRCVPFIHQVFPVYLSLIKTSEHHIRESIFSQLCSLIPIVKDHIKEYLDQLFSLIKEYWQVNNHQISLINLVGNLSVTLKTEFKQQLLPKLLPDILHSFYNDKSNHRQVISKVLSLIQSFDDNSYDFLNVLMPAVLELFDNQSLPIEVREKAFETVKVVSKNLNCQDFFSLIMQPSIKVYQHCPELREVAHDLIFSLVSKYEQDKELIEKILMQNQIVQKASAEEETPQDVEQWTMNRKLTRHQNRISITKKQLTFTNLLELSYSSAVKSNLQGADHIKHLSAYLENSTPSSALKCCLRICRHWDPLPKDVFNAAFISCWNEMTPDNHRKIISELEQILKQENMPEMVTVILNLVEFMDHTDQDFPIDLSLLSEVALRHRTYAKALRFKENEFYMCPSGKSLEALININNKLRQVPAVNGILEYAKQNHAIDFKVKEQWYEKLHDYENALRAYQHKRESNPNDMECIMGQMRCLEMLGEWDELYKLSLDTWPNVDQDQRENIARMCAASAWSLGKWEDMERYCGHIRKSTSDAAFYQAVLSVHRNQFMTAQSLIDEARDKIDSHLTAMVGESQDRAYEAMVSVMLFSELEEVIQYKLVPEKRDLIKQKWWDRLQGCQKIVEDWQKVLRVRSLVLTPQQDKRSWLKFASICQKVGYPKLSQKTLLMLLRDEANPCLPSGQLDTPSKSMFAVNSLKAGRNFVLPANCPEVAYAFIKQLWRSNEKTLALEQMQVFLQELQKQRQVARGSTSESAPTISVVTQPSTTVKLDESGRPVTPTLVTKLLSKGYLKLGLWHEHVQGGGGGIVSEECMAEVLPYYALAADMDPTRYKVWHAYAYCNFRAMSLLKSNGQARVECAVHAVRGFFKSIALCNGNSLQDTLRLLTVLFDEGQSPKVDEAIRVGLSTVPIVTWLQVIPQLIARMDTPRTLVAALIQQLLIDVGRRHPQALIYPLTVAQKSSVQHRQLASNKIISTMREHSNNLVQQAALISDELIRVSILWHELWHEGLEEASRLYFGDKNVKAMLEMLEPLHLDLDRGPTTVKEMSFKNAFGNDLAQAQKLCKKYIMTGDVKNVTQAWEFYYHVFKKISKQLPNLTSLELQYVSPKLLACRDLELAVPGNYNPNRPVVRIARIESELQVITSKQRPRKLCIKGSNGRNYMFLLKGHEDLRQDERVMQLFGLVNTLLADDFETCRRNLAIQRYAVIPLSHNSGLIGWVPHCDTLHTLIKDYREKKKTLLNIEYRIMLRMAPNYDRLTLMQKVEIFEHALDSTQGDDIHCLLWNKSPNSEVWFERRTNYIRSLAVMSMVGYILGLGDRHPSNLMIDRLSGKVLHIDFGDCFEVAMTRDKFPEKIPFRLTRMLIKAMEVTGIEGTYRTTCEKVMHVLRNNKDSLMAVLEAFVYDPLLNWGLNEGAEKTDSPLKSPTSDVVDCMINSTAQLDLSDFPPINDFDTTADMLIEPKFLHQEPLNKKALAVVNRILDKLTGHDFDPNISLSVPHQVDLLIKQATSNENLCQLYIGWCPFW